MKNNFKNINLQYFENIIDLKNKRAVQFTYLVLTIIALIFFGLFAINPTLSTIAKLQKELDDNKFVDEQLEKKIQNLSILQRSYGQIQDDLPIIEDAIPKNPKAPILLAQIQSLAESSGLDLLNSQVFPVDLIQTSKKNYISFSFVVLGEGTQSSIGDFINKISGMERIVSLDQINLTKRADSSGLLQVSVRGSAYFKQ